MKKIVKKLCLIFVLIINIIVILNLIKTPRNKLINKAPNYVDASFASNEYDRLLNNNDKLELINKIEQFTNNDSNYSAYDKIDKILYINLAHRKDRLKQINNEFKRMELPQNKILRIDAVNEKYNGHIGCCKSHIKVMNKILDEEYNYTAVFEDDFVFKVDKETFNNKLNKFFNRYGDKWDVIQLTSGYTKVKNTDINDIKNVQHASTSSAYIINKKFVPILLDDLETALKLMNEDMKAFQKKYNTKKKKYTTNYALDQHWYKLQKKSNWFLFKPFLGKQGGSAGSSSIMSNKIEGFVSQRNKNIKLFKLYC